jgi:hypothetical protein
MIRLRSSHVSSKSTSLFFRRWYLIKVKSLSADIQSLGFNAAFKISPRLFVKQHTSLASPKTLRFRRKLISLYIVSREGQNMTLKPDFF